MDNFSLHWIVIAALFGFCFFSMFFRGCRRNNIYGGSTPAREGDLKAGTERPATSHCGMPGETHERSADVKN